MSKATDTIEKEIVNHKAIKAVLVKRIKLNTKDMKKYLNDDTQRYDEIENNMRMATTVGESIIQMYDSLHNQENLIQLKKTLL